jgi:hypothetical protein
MAVSAKQLSKTGAQGKDIDAIWREQIQIIDDRLTRAPRTWGRNVVTYDLPTSFPGILGLEKDNAQRIIYTSIIKSLDRRGFETRILLESNRTTLYIAWVTDLSAEEVEAMNALIVAKRISRGEELDRFVRQGAAPAPQTAAAVQAGRAKGPPAMKVAERGRTMLPRGGMTEPDPPSTAAASTAELDILRG